MDEDYEWEWIVTSFEFVEYKELDDYNLYEGVITTSKHCKFPCSWEELLEFLGIEKEMAGDNGRE